MIYEGSSTFYINESYKKNLTNYTISIASFITTHLKQIHLEEKYEIMHRREIFLEYSQFILSQINSFPSVLIKKTIKFL